MSTEIALALCMVFIAVLCVRDSTQQRRVSSALWLPTIWTMYCGSRPLSSWFKPELSAPSHIDYTEGSAIDRAFLSIVIVLGLAILWKRRLNWSRIVRTNVWVFVFFSYMALSVLWSDYPGVSFKRWVRTTGDFI